MNIQLVPLHYVYLAFIVLIVAVMIRRRDTMIICVAGIMTIGLLATETLSGAVSGIFNSFVYAAKELLSTIFIISIIVAMSRVLIRTGINEVMVAPLTLFIRSPQVAYWGIGLIMMTVSLFLAFASGSIGRGSFASRRRSCRTSTHWSCYRNESVRTWDRPLGRLYHSRRSQTDSRCSWPSGYFRHDGKHTTGSRDGRSIHTDGLLDVTK